MRTILAARDMTAESCSATALDGRHDLQLLEAHMTGIGFAPRRSVLAEDIRDLQRWTRHNSRASGGRLTLSPNLGPFPGPGLLSWFGSVLRLRFPRLELLRRRSLLHWLIRLGIADVSRLLDQMLERTRNLLDGLGSDAGINGGRVKLGVAQQNLDNSNIDLALEQMRRERMSQDVRGYALVDSRHSSGLKAGTVELAQCQGVDAVLARKQIATWSLYLPPSS
jgi:hypothetical protein